MRNYVKFILSIFCSTFIASFLNAAETSPVKNFSQISKLSKSEQLKEIIDLFYYRYYFSSSFDKGLNRDIDSLKMLQNEEITPLTYLAQSLIVRRKQQFTNAENLLMKAITSVSKRTENAYLLASLYTTLAYAQTGAGNKLGAIHSYRLATMKAETLKDKRRLIIAEIGISDIYRTLQLYNHALLYLNKATEECTPDLHNYTNIIFAILNNKIDVFFAMKNKDSVEFYRSKILEMKVDKYGSAKELLRQEYYALILLGKYEEAIPLIKNIIDLNVKYLRHIDRLNLADCYFKTNRHDSAIAVIKRVVADSVHSYSHIKIYSYKLLADIALSEGDYQNALKYQSQALEESKRNIKEMTQVSDLTSQIRVEQIEIASKTQAMVFKKERTLLIFGLLATALGAIIIGLFYNNIRQKSKYEKLLADSKTRELSFLNSHKTRKPLANILGFCNLARESDSSKSDLLTYFEYITTSAAELDEWVKEVDKKLKED